MDRRFLLVLVVSAALALVVAFGFYRFAYAASLRTVKTRDVVVASTMLPIGARIQPNNVKLMPLPDKFLPHTSFSKISDLQDRVVISPILDGEPIQEDRLAARGSTGGLASMIPEGFRAVSLKVNEVIGVVGFVQPGMHVDVLATFHTLGSGDSVTRTVLQDVLVLSAGHVLEPEPKGEAINATAVTLQVRPSDAEVLTLAATEGKVQLVLRNSVDQSRAGGSGTRLSAVSGSPKPVESAAPGPSPSEPLPASRPHSKASTAPASRAVEQTPVIEVIRGGKRSFDAIAARSSVSGGRP
jgi:pilus assembly protein CpaB